MVYFYLRGSNFLMFLSFFVVFLMSIVTLLFCHIHDVHTSRPSLSAGPGPADCGRRAEAGPA